MEIKNILITGGSGKVGRNLIPELLRAGYSIRAIEYDDGLTTASEVEVIKGDLGDSSLAPEAIKDMDAVIHLANVKENKETFMRTNVQGTFYLLDACKENGSVKQFIQAGSDARAGIYFNPRPYPIDENFPHSAYPGYYAFSKVLEETMCEQYRIQYDLPITVLRFSWVHDEDDILAHATLKQPDFGIPVWRELATLPEQKEYIEKDLDAAVCMIHPNGKPCMRHIVGIKDVVQSCMLAVGNQSTIGHAFTVAAPSAFTYDTMADYISEKLNLPILNFVNTDYHDFQHNLSKSRSILGYKPEYDIFKIIDDAVEFRNAGYKRTPCLYPG